MTASFLPEFNAVPVRGGYRGSYRLFDSQPFRFIPGCEPFTTAGQALQAAKDYVRERLNPPIRGEVTEARDVLGIAQWHEQRAARQAEQQEQALGAIIVKGKQVKVERTKVRA
ncbi:hypothetical protein [Mesorhizobium sp. B2-3-2]|uniref:hypothetical protein n=1 Tax=Mesorhizobium sp. B2-3-2 TaxID=2589961 RepID=UPI001128A076|nr:hypothetical protein [Mesorhizobium sp. B2-3-2]TPM37038.1 hypothetical protein FJ964_30350 [Mesorhizobium sp. B2-3-2]